MIVQPKKRLTKKIFPLFLDFLEYAIFVGKKKIKKKIKIITKKKMYENNNDSILIFFTQRPR